MDQSRDIIKTSDVCLEVTSEGEYLVKKAGYHSYKLKPNSRTFAIIRMLDLRCLAYDRRVHLMNDSIRKVEKELYSIKNTIIYKIFHFLGVI